MDTGNNIKTRIAFVVVLILTVLVVAPSSAAQTAAAVVVCKKQAERLAEQMGVSCEELMDLQATGANWGQARKAWRLSQTLTNVDGGWQALLEEHQNVTGWGHIRKLHEIGGGEISEDELLALRESGLGWGQIKHVNLLSGTGLGVSLDEAIALFQSGAGWGEIRAELGLEEGPPPWSNAGCKKSQSADGDLEAETVESAEEGNNGNGRGNGNGNDKKAGDN